MKIKVSIPLTLAVEVDLSALTNEELEDEGVAEQIAETAAEMLVTVEGLSASHTVTETLHVDGHGLVRVAYNTSEIEISGSPKAEKRKKK